MSQGREVLVAWLNDAYAMERGQIPVLQSQARNGGDATEIQARSEQHLEETVRHAELVESCLELLGEMPSRARSTLANVLGSVESLTTGVLGAQHVQEFLIDIAAESLEIASYEALVSAARDLGEKDIARTCEEILVEEQAMAAWLLGHLPTAVRGAVKEAVGGPLLQEAVRG